MKRFLTAAFLLSIGISPALAATQQRIVLPTNVVPTHYDIAIVPDAGHLTFTGTAKIAVTVKQPTRTIVFNAANLHFNRVSLSGEPSAPKVDFNTAEETATLTFARPVSTGNHVLTIAYNGTIFQHAAGLFALDYDTAHGKKRALFTQFENSDARRFMPCWDEPGIKTTYTLTATVPEGDMALSNMPIATTEKLANGLKRVQFQTTPKMSSYLLFFGIGDLERISKKVDGVDLGVVVKRGDTAKGEYALDAAAHLLPYYEQYFDYKYPLPKLDLIAGPGQSQFFSAMENWGAIFFFEPYLLIDPNISTEADKRQVYTVVAHEMAHQWFGDLVTMAWWDDLWLNEGFASWMENKATDHFHPEWKLWLAAQNDKEAAMHIDQRAGTHPIIQPIYDVLQANEAFDDITYSKGMAVIHMLENYIGEAPFRAGLRAYLKAHTYGNAVTDDLWHALDKTAPAPMTAIAHDFTRQAGVPLIRVAPDTNGIKLTQSRFADDDTARIPTSWHVPVIEKTIGTGKIWHGVVSRTVPRAIAMAKDAIPVVNAGQAGYFRTLYAPVLFTRLADHFTRLSAEDQLGLLNDSAALGYAGDTPLSDFLTLARQSSPQMHPLVLLTLANRLAGLDRLYRGLPGQEVFRHFARAVLDPLYASTGWTAKTGEDQNVALLRTALLSALSQMNDPAVVAEARKQFAQFEKDPSSLSGDRRRNVLAIVAAHADSKTWNALRTMARTTHNSLEKRELYTLLGRAQDPALAQKALAIALTNEAPTTFRPAIIASVSRHFPDNAFDFVQTHLDAVNAALEPDSRNSFAPHLIAGSVAADAPAKLEAFAKKHIPAGARGDVTKAEAALAFTRRIRTQRLPEASQWLAQRHN